MADCALSADACPASSGNSDDISAPSRRALLGAIVTAPIVAGSFATAANAGARDGADTMNMHTAIFAAGTTSRAWDVAYARWRVAFTAHSAACDAHSDAEAAYFAYCRRVAPISLREFQWAPVQYQLNTMPLDQFAGLYDFPYVKPGQFDPIAVTADVERYRKECAAARARFQVDETEEVQSQTCSADCRALDELVVTPAPNMAALAVKIGLLRERDCDEPS